MLLSRIWIEISQAISENATKEPEVESLRLNDQVVQRGGLQQHRQNGRASATQR